jgi:hypothetical protein
MLIDCWKNETPLPNCEEGRHRADAALEKTNRNRE